MNYDEESMCKECKHYTRIKETRECPEEIYCDFGFDVNFLTPMGCSEFKYKAGGRDDDI